MPSSRIVITHDKRPMQLLKYSIEYIRYLIEAIMRVTEFILKASAPLCGRGIKPRPWPKGNKSLLETPVS